MRRSAYTIAILFIMVACGSAFLPEPDLRQPYIPAYPAYFGNNIQLTPGNPNTKAGVMLGRMLFYERLLSANNKISCGSCHMQQHAFADSLRFSKGADGSLQPRNTMALENLLWVHHYFWDGRAADLETQAVSPLTAPHEMGQSLAISVRKLQQHTRYRHAFRQAFGDDTITGHRIAQALAQFERTLISAGSKYDQYLCQAYQPTAAELHGIQLFFGDAPGSKDAGCSHCHGGPKTYTDLFHNNGLDATFRDSGRAGVTGWAIDRGRFRVVSLRNIALTAPYMHDGRFTTLAAVIDHYNAHVQASSTLSPFLQNGGQPQQLHLDSTDKKDLLAFLNMLTDSTFIHNPDLSNPFTP